MRLQAGHEVGKAQTLLLQRLHRYPPRVGLEWQAHRVGVEETMREGKPIIRREDCALGPFADEDEDEDSWAVVGGVVADIRSSRKCCSLSVTV